MTEPGWKESRPCSVGIGIGGRARLYWGATEFGPRLGAAAESSPDDPAGTS